MGFFDSIAATVRNATGSTQIDRLCRELGWDIDERDGERVSLYFKGDRITPQRVVHVMPVADGKFLYFYSICRAVVSSDDLPDDLLPALIVRNQQVFCGGWAASIDDDDDAMFLLRYTTSAAAMDAEFFRHICGSMVEEVAFVEGGLRKQGLM